MLNWFTGPCATGLAVSTNADFTSCLHGYCSIIFTNVQNQHHKGLQRDRSTSNTPCKIFQIASTPVTKCNTSASRNVFFLWSISVEIFVLKLGSSEVEHSLMVRWVVGSILHGVDPLSYFSFQPVLHDWCNKGRGMCYPVCGMVHIKEPLLLIDKSSLCGGSGFPFSISEWSLTICLTPYNRR